MIKIIFLGQGIPPSTYTCHLSNFHYLLSIHPSFYLSFSQRAERREGRLIKLRLGITIWRMRLPRFFQFHLRIIKFSFVITKPAFHSAGTARQDSTQKRVKASTSKTRTKNSRVRVCTAGPGDKVHARVKLVTTPDADGRRDLRQQLITLLQRHRLVAS